MTPYYIFAPGTFNFETSLEQYINSVFPNIEPFFPIDSHNDIAVVKFSEIISENKIIEHKSFIDSGLQFICKKIFACPQDFDYNIDIKEYNFGQSGDIQCIQKVYNDIVTNFPNRSIVCVGVSRGAVALFNWIVTYKNNLKNIKSIILEGMPPSINSVLKNSQGLQYAALEFGALLLPWITNYDQKVADDTFPIKNCYGIPTEIRILLVTSEKDQIVPYKSVIQMYEKLRSSGHLNTNLLILKKSIHSLYTSTNERDTKLYVSVARSYMK